MLRWSRTGGLPLRKGRELAHVGRGSAADVGETGGSAPPLSIVAWSECSEGGELGCRRRLEP
jgi:hypothetical protein